MAPSNSMMSGRVPFGRLLNVGGNSETSWSQIVPFLWNKLPDLVVVRTNRLFFDSWTFPVFNVTSYFFHPPDTRDTVALAMTSLPLVLSIATVTGPEKSFARA